MRLAYHDVLERVIFSSMFAKLESKIVVAVNISHRCCFFPQHITDCLGTIIVTVLTQPLVFVSLFCLKENILAYYGSLKVT